MRLTKLTIPLIALSSILTAQTDPSGRVGRLSYVNGPVSFQPAGMTDWLDAEINRPLTTGDQVWVGDRGRAEIHVGSTALRLGSNTAFQFLNLDDQTIQIQLSQGTLTVRARNLAGNQNLELDTPSLAFTILRPGEYRITADPDAETTTVTTRSGDGEVTAGGQTFPVRQRQQAIVVGGDQITYNLVSAPRDDNWDQWNSRRDRQEDNSPSARYVSPEVGGYEDLDQYGSWQTQPEYGQVWMPTNVASGWAPYHDGHWAWIAPWGWTWVDDAPWGFTPYHYGRWASFRGRWGWVPGPRDFSPVYAPALVGWVGGGRGGGGSGFSVSFSFGNADAVGWFPLGPREPYFPGYGVSSGYFGRVNHANTIIDNRTINNYYIDSRNSNNRVFENIQYANRNVQNAVMAVPQERFASGRRVSEYARAVPGSQLNNVRYAAAPEIAPQRASVLGPRGEQGTRAARPPDAVMNRPVVARTAPPQAVVPFERQQAELNRNPGRPLPHTTVQQLGQDAPARRAPVRVEDMNRVQRIVPKVDAGPQQGGRRTNAEPVNTQRPQPNAPTPPATDSRQNNRPGDPAPRQNGRWSNPVARPDALPPNRPPQPAPDNRRNDRAQPPPARPDALPPNRPPQPEQDNRRNDRTQPPPARPDAPPPAARQQRNDQPLPPARTQPNAPPPERQQPQNRENRPPQAQPDRPRTQPPPQARQAPANKPPPGSSPQDDKGKPEKNDETE